MVYFLTSYINLRLHNTLYIALVFSFINICNFFTACLIIISKRLGVDNYDDGRRKKKNKI